MLNYDFSIGSTWVKEPRGHCYLNDFIISHPQMIKHCHQLAPIAPAATDFEGDVADDAINQVLEMAAPYLVGQRFDKKKNNMLTFIIFAALPSSPMNILSSDLRQWRKTTVS